MIEGNGARGSQTSLREANSASIVEAVRLYGQITQVELSAATGLSPATVSNLVKSLQAAGIVQTSATVRSGRRAQAVSLVRSSDLAVGIHVGKRSIEVLVADASWSVTATQRLPLPPDHRFDTTLDRVALLVADLTEQVGASLNDVGSVGLAMPGISGIPSDLLSGWEQISAPEVLARRLQREVTPVTEAAAVGYAETRFGSLRGVNSALIVRASFSTSAAFFIDGRPIPGAGALGHVRVDPVGRICRCGARGCLNTLVSAEGLADLLRVTHGQISLRAIIQGAQDGDPGCRQVISHAADAIGSAVSDAAVLLSPTRICLAGELASLGDLFLEPIRNAIRSRPLLPDPGELVVLADCNDAEARGALALASDATDHHQGTQG